MLLYFELRIFSTLSNNSCYWFQPSARSCFCSTITEALTQVGVSGCLIFVPCGLQTESREPLHYVPTHLACVAMQPILTKCLLSDGPMHPHRTSCFYHCHSVLIIHTALDSDLSHCVCVCRTRRSVEHLQWVSLGEMVSVSTGVGVFMFMGGIA